jgi:hypothetical protein
MDTTEKQGRRWGAIVGPAALLAGLLGAVAANGSLRAMLAAAVHTMDPRAVAIVLPVQLVAILLCTAAQQALKVGIPFRASLIARIVRDAAHNLLIFPPGLGDAVGVRMVVLLGGRGRAAVALRALDVGAEVVAELPYTALAFWILWHGWHGSARLPGVGAIGWLVLAVPVVAYVAWRIWRASAHHQAWVQTRSGRRVRAEIHLMRREVKRQRAGLPLSVGLHFVAWGMSGLQIWLAARVFGLPLSLFGAFAIESTATSARMILFFVPGGLVMQEAGAVLAGAIMGIAAPQALALSLVLRLRDVVFGAALVLWPALEYRARRRG